jgi:diaminopimelate decarboxylase
MDARRCAPTERNAVNRTTLYERPRIVRHQPGGINKFGQPQRTRVLDQIDGVSVSELVERFGSPLFVFSERRLINRFRELEQAFARRYSPLRIAWSYKTNYLQAICRVFHREGAFAEVVSPFEYDKAIACGVSSEHIHFNGPFKPDDVLARAVKGGTMLHIDNLDEIGRIDRAAAGTGRRARVAVRVNQAIDGVQSWSRFGLNLESGQAQEAIEMVLASGHLDLVGLHTHIGTFILEPRAYTVAATKMAQLANDLLRKHGLRLSFIDLGGGFASPNTLKGQYLDGEQASPSFARYADAICEGLSELEYPPDQMPALVLETGRALVDDAGTLVSTVHATKRLPDGRRALVLDAGVNLLFTSFWYRHDVAIAQDVSGAAEPTVLYGPLCMNIDVMRDSVSLPPLQAGDRLLFRNVGAYNVTQWMQFITLRPAVVMIGVNGTAAVIRRGETVDDLSGYEAVPPWLG